MLNNAKIQLKFRLYRLGKPEIMEGITRAIENADIKTSYVECSRRSRFYRTSVEVALAKLLDPDSNGAELLKAALSRVAEPAEHGKRQQSLPTVPRPVSAAGNGVVGRKRFKSSEEIVVFGRCFPYTLGILDRNLGSHFPYSLGIQKQHPGRVSACLRPP